jgi:hypothetical protein
MQAIDRLSQIGDGPIVHKHVVCHRQASGAADLRCQDCAGLIERAAVACLNSLQLYRFIHVDQEDAVHPAACTAFHEERYGHHNVRANSRFRAALHGCTDQRVKDGLEVLPRARIVENQLPQGAPVEFTVLGNYAPTEPLDHLCNPRCAWRDDFPGRHIGVNDLNSQFRKPLGNRALAAGNSAGEADAQTAPHDLVLEAGHAQIAVDQHVAVHHGEPAGGSKVGPEWHGGAAVAPA